MSPRAENLSIFRHLENSNLDTWLLAKKPLISKDVFVVTITDDDYKEIFRTTSPLQQEGWCAFCRRLPLRGPRDHWGGSGYGGVAGPWRRRRQAHPLSWARELSEDGAPARLAMFWVAPARECVSGYRLYCRMRTG